MGSTKKTSDTRTGSNKPPTSSASLNAPTNANDDADPLASLVREALDPEKPSRLDQLGALLMSIETSDDDVGRLLQLLLADGGVTEAMKAGGKKRVLNVILNTKWAGRGR